MRNQKLCMIKIVTIALFAIAFVTSSMDLQARTRTSVSGEHGRFGLGVNLGEPIGMNARFFFVDQFAFDLNVGYGFGEEAFIVQPSLLFVLKDILDYHGNGFYMVPHFGVGFKTGVDVAGRNKDDAVAAMRFPLGLNWDLKGGQFEISIEFAPGVEFSPETEFDATGGLGLRYYF